MENEKPNKKYNETWKAKTKNKSNTIRIKKIKWRLNNKKWINKNVKWKTKWLNERKWKAKNWNERKKNWKMS